MGADPGRELAVAERLHHVVVGPSVQGADLVVFARSRGEHEYRDLRISPPDVLEELEAVPRAEIEIDDRDAGVFLAQELERSGRVSRAQRCQAGLLYEESKQVQQVAVVVDQQDARAPSAIAFLHSIDTHPRAPRADV